MSNPLTVEPTDGAGLMPEDPPQDDVEQDPGPQFDLEVIG
jgi:hypothetical protein